jgi:hypothetical protein
VRVVREVRDEDFVVHVPTVTVAFLQGAASVIEAAAEQLPDETIYFPPREEDEQQPIELEGYVPLRDLAGLIRYVADMLET